jgi:drug/metabolite transporter (DMT)-like permease
MTVATGADAFLPHGTRTGPDRTDAARGLAIGLVAVTLFAVGVPMTRLATGSVDAPQLPGAFVGFGRGVVGGLLAVVYLLATRAPFPDRAARLPLAIIAAGSVVGFPLAMSVALRHVESTHVSAMLGIGPLLTAVTASRMDRRPQPGAFWATAGAGSLLVAAFPFVKAGGNLGDVGFADAILIGALALSTVAIVHAGRLARVMPAARVTAWSCAFALPATACLAALTWPETTASPISWLGVAGVGVGTVWVGSLLWYRALAIDGTTRTSQLILVQPLMGLGFASVILGEVIDAITLGFGVAIIGTVFAGRRFAARH